MPANTAPIFPLTPRNEWCSLTAANTALDGTGTVGTCFTATTNGSRADKVIARALGSNVASVARFFLNNGSTNATPANNSLIGELALPATTAANDVPVGPELEKAINRSLLNGYKINVCLGTAVAAGWQFTADGGDY